MTSAPDSSIEVRSPARQWGRLMATALVGLALGLGLAGCGGSTPAAGRTPASSRGTGTPSTGTGTTTPVSPGTGTTTPGGPASSAPEAPTTTRRRSATTPPTTARRATTVPTTATHKTTPSTTPARWRPPSPQSSPYSATDQLLNAWSAHHRAAALQVASPAAVAKLFSLAYPSAGLVQDGCSAPPGNEPSACTYRYGNTQDLLSVSVTQFATGWGVTGVELES